MTAMRVAVPLWKMWNRPKLGPTALIREAHMREDLAMRRPMKPQARPTASALPLAAAGALAVGAFAIGFCAIGRLAIGSLAIGRARFRRVEIDELVVGRLHVRELPRGARRQPDAS